MVCNKCGHTFNIMDARIAYSNYGTVQIPRKVCPKCGGTFRSIEIPPEMDQYLYVNEDERYYIYKDKREN